MDALDAEPDDPMRGVAVNTHNIVALMQEVLALEACKGVGEAFANMTRNVLTIVAMYNADWSFPDINEEDKTRRGAKQTLSTWIEQQRFPVQNSMPAWRQRMLRLRPKPHTHTA